MGATGRNLCRNFNGPPAGHGVSCASPPLQGFRAALAVRKPTIGSPAKFEALVALGGNSRSLAFGSGMAVASTPV